jgi:hypothetical protein
VRPHLQGTMSQQSGAAGRGHDNAHGPAAMYGQAQHGDGSRQIRACKLRARPEVVPLIVPTLPENPLA